MFKTATALATLSAYAALVAAQSEVTLYDLSFVPQPTSGGSGLADQFADVLGVCRSTRSVCSPNNFCGSFDDRYSPNTLSCDVSTVQSPSVLMLPVSCKKQQQQDIDEDTPVEEGVIVCKGKLEVQAEGKGQKAATTIEVTETGKPVAVVTITNPANLTLPTGLPGSGSKTSVGMLGFIVAGVAITSQLL